MDSEGRGTKDWSWLGLLLRSAAVAGAGREDLSRDARPDYAWIRLNLTSSKYSNSGVGSGVGKGMHQDTKIW